MSDKIIHDQPSKVVSRPGVVDVEGPDGISVSLTPVAAALTGSQLVEKASEAIGKKAFNTDAIRRDLAPPFPD